MFARASVTRVDYILDGGECAVGIESTVLSLAGGRAMLLRPGGISRDTDRRSDWSDRAADGSGSRIEAHPSPGMHPRHYSPRTKLLLVRGGAVPEQGSGAYVQLHVPPLREVRKLVQMPSDPAEYAARLYGTLHELDAEQFDWIAVDSPDDNPEWEAVRIACEERAGPDGNPR